MEQAGMGIGVGDYDLDGHLDLFKTHFADDANILYHNDGKGNFEDATGSSRVGVETRYVCWGAGIVDSTTTVFQTSLWLPAMFTPS